LYCYIYCIVIFIVVLYFLCCYIYCIVIFIVVLYLLCCYIYWVVIFIVLLYLLYCYIYCIVIFIVLLYLLCCYIYCVVIFIVLLYSETMYCFVYFIGLHPKYNLIFTRTKEHPMVIDSKLTVTYGYTIHMFITNLTKYSLFCVLLQTWLGRTLKCSRL
jgi:hypothetical protein